ncbi:MULTISPECIES: MFS transporter [Prauserella salsuginis group]|uniref:DHA1 family inner membrane transport protein n=2 Tax=Prauserella salsuginis group TaxID=2893672 RepID=A0A839XXJ9_9PSEU|nr:MULTISPECIES: MFS transporter [Prauserella salsuginis group]MBB3664746.1 DHA1 family inner membrane transport protein [Prauserella sediminis]
MAVALCALALGAFAIGTTEFVIMGLLPQVAGGLDVSVATAGNLISAYALGVVVGAPLLTAVATRLGRKQALLAFLALFVLGNVATVFVPGYGGVFASRVIAGLPHGAYLGAASLVAAQLVGPARQATAVARVLMGLTVANIVGVPAGTFLGQVFGWRAAFLVVGVLGLLAAAGVAAFVPALPKPEGVGLRTEVVALGRKQVVLGLTTAVFGFAGVFAVYSYISPMLTELAGLSDGAVPVVLALFGAGMTAGSLIVGPLADRALRPTIYGSLMALAVALLVFWFAIDAPWSAVVMTVVLGAVGFGVTAPLQVLIMQKAGRAPTLAAASNHSAFNLANAGGAWLGGVGISAGLGYASPAIIGAVLAVVGLGIAVVAGMLDRDPSDSRPVAADPGSGDADSAGQEGIGAAAVERVG